MNPDDKTRSTTDRVRTWNMILFTAVVLGGLAGWLLGKDPSQLALLLGSVTAGMGIGEASARTKTVAYAKETKRDALSASDTPAGGSA